MNLNDTILYYIFSFLDEDQYITDYSQLFQCPEYQQKIREKTISYTRQLTMNAFYPLQTHLQTLFFHQESGASTPHELYEFLSIYYNIPKREAMKILDKRSVFSSIEIFASLLETSYRYRTKTQQRYIREMDLLFPYSYNGEFIEIDGEGQGEGDRTRTRTRDEDKNKNKNREVGRPMTPNKKHIMNALEKRLRTNHHNHIITCSR